MVNQISHSDNSQLDVDLVYLWVDGNDENLRKSINLWKEKLNIPISNDTNTCRYIDNEELKYSLRSVEKNIPWIHKIYIVTNGQVPKWLNTNNSKIRIVTHEEIMPKEVLPTFNSRVIESYVANIPELSEHFLVANDDCFVARPMKKFDFFTKDGKPRVRLFPKQLTRPELKKSLYNRSIFYSIQLLKKKFNKKYKYVNQHNIDAYTKTDYLDCINEFSNEFSDLREMRFRRLSVQRIILTTCTSSLTITQSCQTVIPLLLRLPEDRTSTNICSRITALSQSLNQRHSRFPVLHRSLRSLRIFLQNSWLSSRHSLMQLMKHVLPRISTVRMKSL